jgi:hypothetical protein
MSIQTGAAAVVQGDFNNDGKPDILVGSELQLGNRDGTFQPSQTVATIPNGAEEMAAADLTGDGNLDLAAITLANPSLYIWFGNGTALHQRKSGGRERLVRQQRIVYRRRDVVRGYLPEHVSGQL